MTGVGEEIDVAIPSGDNDCAGEPNRVGSRERNCDMEGVGVGCAMEGSGSEFSGLFATGDDELAKGICPNDGCKSGDEARAELHGLSKNIDGIDGLELEGFVDVDQGFVDDVVDVPAAYEERAP